MRESLEFDVVVCGGGTAGSVAAIRAARLGLRTALIERQSQLGGTATLGLVTPCMPNAACGVEMVGGLHRELHRRLTEEGKGDTHGFDPARAAMLLEEFAVDAGVVLAYHTELIGVERQGDSIQAVELSSSGRRRRMSASNFIDATGDAVLSMLAGVPLRSGREGTGEHQPMSLRFVMAGVDVRATLEYIQKTTPPGRQAVWPCGPEEKPTLSIHPDWLEEQAAASETLTPWANRLTFSFYTIPGRSDAVCFNAPRVLCGDPSDTRSLSTAYADGRKQIRAYHKYFRTHVPGFANAYIDYIAPLIGIRESRRIEGRFTLTEDHVRNFARFDDAVCLCNYAIDIHHSTDRDATLWYLPSDQWYEIPYRCLLPARINNLIVAGRCISSDFVAQSSYRIIPVCRALGEASAFACATARRKQTPAAEIDGSELKQQLLQHEVIVIPNSSPPKDES